VSRRRRARCARGGPSAVSGGARSACGGAALARRAHAPAAARRLGWPLAGGARAAMAAGVAIWIGVRAPSRRRVVARRRDGRGRSRRRGQRPRETP
jgi:hypothetical protein